jgi:hypothetical protein
MPGQIAAPHPGGRAPRDIPPLPAGIPILPGQARAGAGRRRFPAWLIVLLVIAALGALEWFNIWYSDYDKERIDPVVTHALLAHVPKGTRLPVTLWSGPRILQIELAFPEYHPHEPPTTCVTLDVLDPNTGATDPKYPNGTARCIEGVAVTIR